MATTTASWWRQPEHFDWLCYYLRMRRMASMTRTVVVVIALSLAAIPLAMLVSTAPPREPQGMALAVLASMGGTSAALLWALRFPTKNQSIDFAVTATVSITTAVLAQSDPLIGLLAGTAFATMSGYIALFHTGALMTINLATALMVSAVPAASLAQTTGVVRAACAYMVVLIVNLDAPFGIQIIVHTLGVDLIDADRDPQARSRAVNAPHLVALVRVGAAFHQGKLLEQPVASRQLKPRRNRRKWR